MEDKRAQGVQKVETLADERFLIFVRKKAERMTTALYLVTDLLSDQEPLKWSLRHQCITLLGELLPHVRRALATRDAEAVASRVSEITSLLGVARSARLFSVMNAKLLQDACDELATLLGELGTRSDLSRHMLEVPEQVSLEPQALSQAQKAKTTEGHLNDTVPMSDRMSFKKEMSHSKTKKRQQISTNNVSGRRERQERIITLLRNRGKSTMTDIKGAITGVSDKTLQRDIVELVQRGVLARSGSKRWTSYSLV